jgi:hypothetical protein
MATRTGASAGSKRKRTNRGTPGLFTLAPQRFGDGREH